MGWKIRKDKLQSDAMPPSDADEQTANSHRDATRFESAEDSETVAREPYVMDLDPFGNTSQSTSLDPSAFSWFRTAPINSPESDADEVPFAAKPTSQGNGQARSASPFDFSTPTIEPSRPSPPSQAPRASQPAFDLDVPPAFAAPAPNPVWEEPVSSRAQAATAPPAIDQLRTPQQPNNGRAAGTQQAPIADSYVPSRIQIPQQGYGQAMSHQQRVGRDDLAAGLVSQGADLGIPKVAPFILDMGAESETVDPVEQPTLVMRFKNLAARYTITKSVITMGRPDSDTGNYPDVEIEMDEGVSRKHAEIRLRDSRYYLIDMGSTNGTLLNGQAVIALTENLLRHGDRIRIGEMTEITFE